MRKRTFKDFILYFSIAFVLYSLLAFIMIAGLYTAEAWGSVFFTRRFISLPLIVYLLAFSLITAVILFIYLKITEKRQTKRIAESLKMLNEGQYRADIFLEMFSSETPVQINEDIDREILRLHEKMMLISEEAVSSAQQASTISEESKEEILEEERHRIARELHDSVSQQLFAAAMLLSTVQSEADALPDDLHKQIDVIGGIIGDAQSEMRALLLHLRPVKLDGKSLQKGVEQLLNELKTKVPITITHEIADITLTEVIEDHLFRIIQELLSNVLRHSQADELEVYLKKSDDYYQLRMIDDGEGFDMEEKQDSGFGLRNIRERIAGLGGNVRIISFPDQGTSVEIRIPLITGG